MRKAKLDAETEKPVGPFFDDENHGENDALSFANTTMMSEIEEDEGFVDEHKSFVTILRRVFLFLPGTFLLFFMSFGAAIVAMEIIVYRRALETLPDDFPFQFALMGLIVFLGTLMTWFGLGDIKNRRHFAIPASLMVAGAIIGAVVKATAGMSNVADRMLDDFSYLIYLLPLALIIPVLAKGIANRKPKDREGAVRQNGLS